jgi:nucleoside-diphosphate-sugar epimerase
MPAAKPHRFTILGGAGFIGSHLVSHLRGHGHECHVPARDEILTSTLPLGHVVYCIGLTADFRSRPFDTVEAHTGLFAALLRSARFDSLVYLSSARVYQSADSGGETARFTVDPADPSHLYNLTKLTAESLCLSLDRPEVRIARLSNVYGPDFESDNFLTSVIRDAVQRASVRLEAHPDGAKDYVAIADVTEMLERIALEGRHRIYNVAAGRNVANGEIMSALRELTGCAVEWTRKAPLVAAPPISIELLQEEFGYAPRQLSEQLPSLVAQYRKRYAAAGEANPDQRLTACT